MMEYAIVFLLLLILANVADDKTIKWMAIGFAVLICGFFLLSLAYIGLLAWPWSQFF